MANGPLATICFRRSCVGCRARGRRYLWRMAHVMHSQRSPRQAKRQLLRSRRAWIPQFHGCCLDSISRTDRCIACRGHRRLKRTCRFKFQGYVEAPEHRALSLPQLKHILGWTTKHCHRRAFLRAAPPPLEWRAGGVWSIRSAPTSGSAAGGCQSYSRGHPSQRASSQVGVCRPQGPHWAAKFPCCPLREMDSRSRMSLFCLAHALDTSVGSALGILHARSVQGSPAGQVAELSVLGPPVLALQLASGPRADLAEQVKQ